MPVYLTNHHYDKCRRNQILNFFRLNQMTWFFPIIHQAHEILRDVFGTHPMSEAYWSVWLGPSPCTKCCLCSTVVNTGASHSPLSKQSKTAPIQRKNSRSQCRQCRMVPHDSRHHWWHNGNHINPQLSSVSMRKGYNFSRAGRWQEVHGCENALTLFEASN